MKGQECMGNIRESYDMPHCSSFHQLKNTTFTGVDIFKFFFAICIVALHSNALSFLPETANYWITKIVFRAAVPYFFVASGFFFGKKIMASPKEKYAKIVRTYCSRLLKPLIFFEIISLIYYAYVYLKSGNSLFVTMLLLGQSILFYPKGALWYIQACIIGVLLLYPFLKQNRLNIALIIGVILYGFALIANNYSFLVSGTPLESVVVCYLEYCVSARNGLFTGFIFIAIGVLCCRIYNSISVCSIFKNLCILVTCFIAYISEIFFISKVGGTPLDDGSLYITHLFYIPALLLFTLQLNISIPSKLSMLLRNLSTGIYFLHRPLLYVFTVFIMIEWLLFLCVLIVAVLICLFVYKLRLKPLDSLLK